MNSEQEKTVLLTLNRMQQMFTNPTRELFAEIFTANCDYVTFQGQHLRGIEENFEAHYKLAQLSIFKGVKLEGHLVSIKFLNDTTAVVIMKGALVFRWQKKAAPSRMSINTNVLTLENNQWKVCSFQNTRIHVPFLKRLFG